jgi:hypothetical protein
LIRKICEITSGELIFWRILSTWDHCAERGRGLQMSFARAHVRSSTFAFTYIANVKSNKNKEYVRRV